ncbi:MAG TPA: hypothetical protein ENH84_01410, partial [Phycisphaerae bacterium]|nr:hypothetical protein [Phycisphaerae bacterium]
MPTRRLLFDFQPELAKHFTGKTDNPNIADTKHHHLHLVVSILHFVHSQISFGVMFIGQTVHLACRGIVFGLFQNILGPGEFLIADLGAGQRHQFPGNRDRITLYFHRASHRFIGGDRQHVPYSLSHLITAPLSEIAVVNMIDITAGTVEKGGHQVPTAQTVQTLPEIVGVIPRIQPVVPGQNRRVKREIDQHSFNVGLGKLDYTPEIGLPLMGNFRDDYASRGVHDPLGSHAIVIEGDGGDKLAMLSIDICMFRRRHTALMREYIASKCDVSGENILIAGTHTHSAPSVCEFGALPQCDPG